MRRGEIWWALLAPKPRPVVLVSRNSHLEHRRLVMVAPVTTRARGVASEVVLGREDGLAKECVADAGSLLTIDKTTLADRRAELSFAKKKELDRALSFALGLDGAEKL